MARYKAQECNSLLFPVILSEQIVPGSFAFALNHLVDHELDLSELDARFRNDEVGASAYDPRVMLKIVLLAYSQGLVSSRAIEQACQRSVQFIAISGDSQPSHAHIAKFVVSLSEQIKPLFSQVLMICDAQGLIGRDMFAIDGVKLPSNASKERSGTHEELRHRAKRLDLAADKIMTAHQVQDKHGAGHLMSSPGSIYTTATGLPYQSYIARAKDCLACELSDKCLRDPLKPNDGRGRQVSRFGAKEKDPNNPSERMRQAIDSARGRQLYSQRIGTVEPVFANLRHNKRLTRLNHRGRIKVNTQWNLY